MLQIDLIFRRIKSVNQEPNPDMKSAIDLLTLHEGEQAEIKEQATE